MRYRKQTSSGDYQFGHGSADFWFNQVDGVGQAIKTKLGLFRGEWFIDLSDGTPWGGFPLNDAVVAQGQILGKNTELTRDMAIKTRVLETPGVLAISEYSSSTDTSTREFTVNMVVDTIYGRLAQSLKGTVGSGAFEISLSPIGGSTPL